MSSCHLVPYLYLPLFGYIHFIQTNDTRGKLITYGNTVFLTLVNTVNLLVLDNIIMK